MAENNNLLRDAVTRIPIWNGDGKDVFTPEQWLARIEKARVAATWLKHVCNIFLTMVFYSIFTLANKPVLGLNLD